MKKGIHPEYKVVAFEDISSGHKFLIKSTIKAKNTITLEDGKDYPHVKVEISSKSHPLFTGKKIFVDADGRVNKFLKKYAKKDHLHTENKTETQ